MPVIPILPSDPDPPAGGGDPPPPAPTPTPGPTPTPTPVPTPTEPAPAIATIPAIPVPVALARHAERIPLAAVPAQVLTVRLGNQPCRIAVRQKSTGMFLDLYVADKPIVLGVICLDRTYMIRSAYLGFVGDLAFVDTQGRSDPLFGGLTDRYKLLWVSSV